MSEKCQTLVAEGDAIHQDPIAQQHELLVSEIESTDGHLGTALRYIIVSFYHCVCFDVFLLFLT